MKAPLLPFSRTHGLSFVVPTGLESHVHGLFAGTPQVAQCLMGSIGYPDRLELAGARQRAQLPTALSDTNTAPAGLVQCEPVRTREDQPEGPLPYPLHPGVQSNHRVVDLRSGQSVAFATRQSRVAD